MSFYFLLFVIGCALVLAAVAWRPGLVYEYPYFMGATFIAFILPQLYALVANEWGGIYLEMTTLMCLLSLICCSAGYLPKSHPALLEKLNVPVNTVRFLHGGIVLVAVGYYFMWKMAALPETDESTGLMTGIGTIYLFFGGLVYPGFAICFYCALKDGRGLAWLAAIVAALVPVQAAVFYGRREPTVLFVLSLGMSLFFLKGKAAPRWLAVGTIVAAMFAIPATGQYRQLAKEDPLEALKQINFRERLAEYLDEDAISEVKNAAVYIAATEQSGDYQWGVGYWNRIVFRFVPAQFLGEGFKNALMIGGIERDPADFMEEHLGYRPSSGSTVTGLGDAFNQFGYFGCLFFAAVAYLFKNLWTAANHPEGTIAQILYIQITTTAMRSLTHQTIDFLPGFLYSAIFIGAVAFYARERDLMSADPGLARLRNARATRDAPKV